MPPKPGIRPSLISGCPKTAERAAIRKSAASASSEPPPKASALTAAIVTIELCSNPRNRAWVSASSCLAPSSPIVVNARMSAPAEKTADIGDADAKTTARAPDASAWSQTFFRSATTAGEIELTGGLSSQAIRTPPSRVSILTFSAGCWSSYCG